jgi:hypothetical protein
MHKIQRALFADVFVKSAAKVIGNIIFSVGKSSRASESAHNGAALAVDAGFYFFSVDGAFALTQCMTGFENRDLERGIE